jgi:hypothetical protein
MSLRPPCPPRRGRSRAGRVAGLAALAVLTGPSVGAAQTVAHRVPARLVTTVGPLVRSAVAQVTRDSTSGVAVVRVEANTAWLVRATPATGVRIELRVDGGPWLPLSDALAAISRGAQGATTVTVEWRAADRAPGRPLVTLSAVPDPTAR